MNNTEQYFKIMNLINDINICYNTNLKISMDYDKHSNDCINIELNRLLHLRKEVAKLYIENKLDIDKQNELFILFAKYNEEIIKLIGFNTI